MAKIEQLLNRKILSLKCIVYTDTTYSNGIEADVFWESDKLMLSFLQQRTLKQQPHIKTFYCVSIAGEKFKIIEGAFYHSEFHGKGLSQFKYTVIELIEEHFDNELYNECNISFDHLPEWLQLDAIETIFGETEDAYERIHLKKLQLVEHVFKVNDISVKLMPHINFHTSGEFFRSYNIQQSFYFKITPELPQTKKWFSDIFLKLRDLLTLLIGHKIIILNLKFKHTSQTALLSYYNFLYITQEYNPKINYYDVLLPYTQITDSFNNILTHWYDLISNENMYDTVRLLVSNFYLKQFEESIFLNYMQGLEGFHRLKHGSGYLTDKQFRPFRKEISQFIDTLKFPENVAGELKTSIKNRLIHSYEYSLELRLQEMFQTIDENILTLLFKENEMNKFIKEIKKTRNNLTHPNEKTQKHVQSYYPANRKLKIIFMTILLTELGINGNLIRERLEINPTYRGSLTYLPETKFEKPHLKL